MMATSTTILANSVGSRSSPKSRFPIRKPSSSLTNIMYPNNNHYKSFFRLFSVFRLITICYVIVSITGVIVSASTNHRNFPYVPSSNFRSRRHNINTNAEHLNQNRIHHQNQYIENQHLQPKNQYQFQQSQPKIHHFQFNNDPGSMSMLIPMSMSMPSPGSQPNPNPLKIQPNQPQIFHQSPEVPLNFDSYRLHPRNSQISYVSQVSRTQNPNPGRHPSPSIPPSPSSTSSPISSAFTQLLLEKRRLDLATRPRQARRGIVEDEELDLPFLTSRMKSTANNISSSKLSDDSDGTSLENSGNSGYSENADDNLLDFKNSESSSEFIASQAESQLNSNVLNNLKDTDELSKDTLTKYSTTEDWIGLLGPTIQPNDTKNNSEKLNDKLNKNHTFNNKTSTKTKNITKQIPKIVIHKSSSVSSKTSKSSSTSRSKYNNANSTNSTHSQRSGRLPTSTKRNESNTQKIIQDRADSTNNSVNYIQHHTSSNNTDNTTNPKIHQEQNQTDAIPKLNSTITIPLQTKDTSKLSKIATKSKNQTENPESSKESKESFLNFLNKVSQNSTKKLKSSSKKRDLKYENGNIQNFKSYKNQETISKPMKTLKSQPKPIPIVQPSSNPFLTKIQTKLPKPSQMIKTDHFHPSQNKPSQMAQSELIVQPLTFNNNLLKPFFQDGNYYDDNSKYSTNNFNTFNTIEPYPTPTMNSYIRTIRNPSNPPFPVGRPGEHLQQVQNRFKNFESFQNSQNSYNFQKPEHRSFNPNQMRNPNQFHSLRPQPTQFRQSPPPPFFDGKNRPNLNPNNLHPSQNFGSARAASKKKSWLNFKIRDEESEEQLQITDRHGLPIVDPQHPVVQNALNPLGNPARAPDQRIEKKTRILDPTSLVPLDKTIVICTIIVGWMAFFAGLFSYKVWGKGKKGRGGIGGMGMDMDKLGNQNQPLLLNIPQDGTDPFLSANFRALDSTFGSRWNFTKVLEYIEIAQKTYEGFDWQNLDCQKRVLCELAQKDTWTGDLTETGRKLTDNYLLTVVDALDGFPIPRLIQVYLKEYKEAISQGKNSPKQCGDVYKKCKFSIKEVIAQAGQKKLN